MILKIPDDIGSSNAALLYVLKNKDIVNLLIELSEQGYVDKNYKLTRKGNNIVNKIELVQKDDKEIETLAIEYRNCFKDPSGKALKPGVTGNLELLKERLREFKETYKYSNEEIIKAIKLYVQSERVNDFKYLQKTHYTVKKKMGSEWDSRLLTFCEELENEEYDEENKFGEEL